jgi:CspA family cold shock protein
VFTDRAPRPDRSSVRNAHFTKGANPARGSEAVVSFFNDAKGFGFASDDKGDDLFIHFSNIVGDGFKSLAQGQKITFEEANGPKGREARNVRVVSGGRERRR